MNKTDALARLAAMEKETSELRKIIEAPEPAASLLTKPRPGSGEDYWYLTGDCTGPLFIESGSACSTTPRDYAQGSFFQSEAIAEYYAEAIDTMLLLRHQPGSEASLEGNSQWFIGLGIRGEVEVTLHARAYTKLSKVSPAFGSREYAEDAVTNVGEARIVRMFKTFHHVA